MRHDAVVATYSRSRLREPEVIKAATRGPVEITTGSGQEPLILLPQRMVAARREVAELTELFLRVVTTLRLSERSPILLGAAGFIAAWPAADQQRFLDGFAEALSESVRTDDPAPVRFYLDACERAAGRPTTSSPTVTGDVSDAAARAIEARVGRST